MISRPSFRAVLALVLAIGAAVSCAPWAGGPVRFTESADAALIRGDTSRALEILEPLASSGLSDPDIIIRLGLCYRWTGTIIGRLRSREILEQGLRKHPDHPGILLELGKTYYFQTFYPDAERCFKRVATLDPSNCEAPYFLGLNSYRKWKHVQLYGDYLSSANFYFERAVACDPSNADAHFKLAFGAYALGDKEKADLICARMIRSHPGSANAHFLRGAMAFEKARYEEAQKEFDTALMCLDPEERRHFTAIALLVPDDVAAEFEQASKDKQNDLTRIFWIERDPDPTTELNESYLEHVYRTFLADMYYSNYRPRLRGWETERGLAMIKFGRPSVVRSTLAGGPWDGRTEIWIYGDAETGRRFIFRDEFLNGNYRIPNEKDFLAQALFLDAPKNTYVLESVEIPGALDAISFRDDLTSSTVYLIVDVDVDSLSSQLDLAETDRFISRGAVFDGLWRPTVTFRDTLSSGPFRTAHRLRLGSFQFVKALTLPFDDHHVVFRIEDPRALVHAQLKSDSKTLRYLSDSLLLSDILLYRPGGDGSGRAACLERNGKKFTPNANRRYDGREKLGLYMEIYNLSLQESASRYQISYSIFDASNRKEGLWPRFKRGLKDIAGFRSPAQPIISHTFERRGSRHRADEDLAIDIAALDAGSYVITVSVIDQISKRTSEQTAVFSKLGRDPNSL